MTNETARPIVALRPVQPTDLETFFAMMADPAAQHMAAFTWPNPTDRTAFDARYARLLANPAVLMRTIVLVEPAGERVAGSISRWYDEGKPEVTYWIDRALWGRGIAGAALRLLLAELDERPIYALAAADNTASLRVLERCGFQRVGTEQGFANARDATIDEVLLVLAANPAPTV